MNRLSSVSLRLGAAALLVALAACGDNTKNQAYIEKPVDDLYNTAMDQLVEESYAKAAKTFDEVESQHPYSVWATKSQLMAVYANYENGKYNDAIIAADRFIQLHPGSSRDRLCLLRQGNLLLHPDRRCRPRPEDHRAGAQGAGRCRPPLSRQQIRARRQAEARLYPRPSRRQGDGDRALLPEARPSTWRR